MFAHVWVTGSRRSTRFVNIGEHPHTPPKSSGLLYRLLYGHLSQRPCHYKDRKLADVTAPGDTRRPNGESGYFQRDIR